MSLNNFTTYVKISSVNKEYYIKLGYNIPHYLNHNNKYVVKRGTQIKVNVEHIPQHCDALLELKCDMCGTVKLIENKAYRKYECYKNGNFGDFYCSDCSRKSNKTTNMYKQEVYNLVGDEYEIMSNYVNNEIKIKIKHNKCGYTFETTPKEFLKGSKCPICSKFHKLDQDSFLYKFLIESKGEYKLLSKYNGNGKHIEIQHNKCGHVYNVTPNNFFRGKRCPNCINLHYSKGVKRIHDYLLSKLFNNINLEFKFNDCLNTKELPFDVFLKTEKIILFEYDGEQHFKIISSWGGKEHFEYRKYNDKIKNQYCIDNNIPLIRIPFWEFDNIEYILENVLVHYSLIENKNNTYDRNIVLKYLVDQNWNHDEYIEFAPCNKKNNKSA